MSTKRLNLLKYILLMVIGLSMYQWLTLVLRPGYEVNTNEFIAPECCTLNMQPGDATNNHVQYCIQNVTSATPWVKLDVSSHRLNL